MALIACPDCNKQVSDVAITCPNCGYPFGSFTYYDNKSGLTWALNGALAETTMHWEKAADLVSKLNYAGHNDWRLPTRDEIKSLLNLAWKDMGTPLSGTKLPNGTYSKQVDDLRDWYYKNNFKNVSKESYWLIEHFESNLSDHYIVNMITGELNICADYGMCKIWPVRGGTSNAIKPELLFEDLVNGLVWPKNALITETQMSFQECRDWISRLDYGGYTDWRMPTVDELDDHIYDLSDKLIDWFKQYEIINFFKYKEYWSSTTSMHNEKEAIIVQVNDCLRRSAANKLNGRFSLWPVRSKNSNSNKRIVTNNDDFIYHDIDINVMWAGNANCPQAKMTFEDADRWVKHLNYGGFTDWRLPRSIDFCNLFKHCGDGLKLDWLKSNGFIKTQDWFYWTRDQNGDYANTVEMRYGMTDEVSKKKIGCAIPFRYNERIKGNIMPAYRK